VFTAAAVNPASSRASNIVTAPRERWTLFISTIASLIARRVPAARIAPNDDPYSTSLPSPRWYQTRCGMW
jgi:hypothetical protein